MTPAKIQEARDLLARVTGARPRDDAGATSDETALARVFEEVLRDLERLGGDSAADPAPVEALAIEYRKLVRLLGTVPGVRADEGPVPGAERQIPLLRTLLAELDRWVVTTPALSADDSRLTNAWRTWRRGSRL